jgi:transcriptional regulator with XRE-family HTH domain
LEYQGVVMSNYGAFQKQRRHELGLSQVALGKRLGITDQAVGEWERGTTPTRVPPDKIATALEVSTEDVLLALGRATVSNTNRAGPISEHSRTQARLETLIRKIPQDDLDQLC